MKLTVILLSIFFWVSFSYGQTYELYKNGKLVWRDVVSAAPIPTPTPTPTPEPPIPIPPVTGLGSKADPVLLNRPLPGVNGFGFARDQGNAEFQIAFGQEVWFKFDPVSILGRKPNGLRFNLIDYAINRNVPETNNIRGTVYRVSRTTGAESLRAIFSSAQDTFTEYPYAQDWIYLIMLKETGYQGQGISIFWVPF